MLPVLLFNVISGLVIDRAQDLAKDHVEDMIDSILPKDAKKELDKVIKEDPTHKFNTAKEALMGTVEGKLPVVKADGSLLPLEITIKLKIDPTTGSFDIVKQ